MIGSGGMKDSSNAKPLSSSSKRLCKNDVNATGSIGTPTREIMSTKGRISIFNRHSAATVLFNNSGSNPIPRLKIRDIHDLTFPQTILSGSSTKILNDRLFTFMPFSYLKLNLKWNGKMHIIRGMQLMCRIVECFNNTHSSKRLNNRLPTLHFPVIEHFKWNF